MLGKADYDSEITLNKKVVKDDLIEEIVRLIVKNVEQYKIPQNEICVVAPQWVHIASVTRKLMLALPDFSFDGPGMAPFSRDLENFWYKLSRIILTEPSPGMYTRRLRWAREIINQLNEAGFSLSQITSKRLLKICNSLNINETEGLQYLKVAFKNVLLGLEINILNSKMLQEHHNSFFESSNNE